MRSLWVTHSSLKARVGLSPTASCQMKCYNDATGCRSLWAAINSRFHFLSSFGFWSVIYHLNGHWDYPGKWHFKDGLTPAHLPDCPKSKNNGCTTVLQNNKPSKTWLKFNFNFCNSDFLSRLLKGFLAPEASWVYSAFLFQVQTNHQIWSYSRLICILAASCVNQPQEGTEKSV